jgi:hypothetical protein
MIPSTRITLHGRLRSRLSLAMLLAACAAAVACERGQPTDPERVAPERPSLTLNPACDPGLGGQTHTDSVLAPETWTRANNPHRVDGFVHIEGAGVLTLQPGVLVCFGTYGALLGENGGRLAATGLDTARIVLTATDPAIGWWGVHLADYPSAASTLKHVRLEHSFAATALSTHDDHAVLIDSAVFRQNENGLYLWGRGTSIRHSRVDTVRGPAEPAVTLGNLVTWERNVVSGAAGVGLAVLGTANVTLLGGRIEGSGGVGLKVTTTGIGFVDADPVRVVGGAGYPAEMVVSAFPVIYPAVADQDSLLGNTRDTLVVTGGILQQWAQPGPALPWRVTDRIRVQGSGILLARPGASLAMDSAVYIIADDGGRVLARGTAAAAVLFTSTTSAGWLGIRLTGVTSLSSYLTNVRVEHVNDYYGVNAYGHPVVIDSSVFRQNGSAMWLSFAASRVSRTRVDTTLFEIPAVMLGGNVTLESTLIRGSAGSGLATTTSGPQILSCEIRDSAEHGIEFFAAVEVHNCNLFNNGGAGIHRSGGSVPTNVEDNWWGDASGPFGPNGDGANGALDYSPWRTTPYVLPYVP